MKTIKRYTSGDKLGRAWLDQVIKCEVTAGRVGGYKITADPDTIWNGEKTQVLVRRNRKLNLVLALQQGSVSLGKSALSCIVKATRVPAVYKWNYSQTGSTRTLVSKEISPVPYIFLPNIEDAALSSCDLATLQPLVLENCKVQLKSLLSGFRRHIPGKYQYTNTNDGWEKQRQILKSVGLDIPKEYEDKKMVAIATRRLTTNTHHL